ncbi:MAG: L,D-transpeptidase family protein [Pseudomonadota bacterium]
MRSADAVLTPMGLRVGGRRMPVEVGRGGLTASKREGDGATPRGRWRITALLYRADRVRPPAPWALPIGPGDLWSDDPADPAYNTWVRAPHPFGHERLHRPDGLYDIVLTTDWNWPDAVPGRGSAIFVHCRRGPGRPTAGCLALRRADLAWLATRMPPGASIWVP